MSEGLLQKYLFARAKENGIYCRKMAAVGRRGFPDVLLARGGRLVLVELKNPNGKGQLSKIQELEIERLRAVGLDVRVLWTKEGVDDVIQELTTA